MAAGSQIHKAHITLANLNTNYYQDFSVTMPLHPSETKERRMFRLLAFLHSAHDQLEFSDGLNNLICGKRTFVVRLNTGLTLDSLTKKEFAKL